MNSKSNMTETTFNLPPLMIPKNWKFYHYEVPVFNHELPQRDMTIDSSISNSKFSVHPSFNPKLSVLFYESLAQYDNKDLVQLKNKEMNGHYLFDCPERVKIEGALALIQLDQVNREKSLIEILRTTLSK